MAGGGEGEGVCVSVCHGVFWAVLNEWQMSVRVLFVCTKFQCFWLAPEVKTGMAQCSLTQSIVSWLSAV